MSVNKMCVRGVDVSMTAELEALGVQYRNREGAPGDLFEILAKEGVNLVRLRLWVNPRSADGSPFLGGTNDLSRTIELAQRAYQAGHNIMLDIHYSDFWTDPKKQKPPRAWEGLVASGLEAKVRSYTENVVEAFQDAAVPLAYVQVGNEITNGMLWPHGETPHYLFDERNFESTDPAEWQRSFDALASLLRAGVAGVRAKSPTSSVVLHLDFGGADDLYRRWFDEVESRKVDFDVIGLSYYPMWHGTLTDLERNLRNLVERYGKDVCVVETAYGYRPDTADGSFAIFDENSAEIAGYPASVEGQTQFLRDLCNVVLRVPHGRGLGIIYWEPAWIPVNGSSWASEEGMEYGHDYAEPGNNWSNQAMFDENARALDSWDAFSPEPRQ